MYKIEFKSHITRNYKVEFNFNFIDNSNRIKITNLNITDDGEPLKLKDYQITEKRAIFNSTPSTNYKQLNDIDIKFKTLFVTCFTICVFWGRTTLTFTICGLFADCFELLLTMLLLLQSSFLSGILLGPPYNPVK